MFSPPYRKFTIDIPIQLYKESNDAMLRVVVECDPFDTLGLISDVILLLILTGRMHFIGSVGRSEVNMFDITNNLPETSVECLLSKSN